MTQPFGQVITLPSSQGSLFQGFYNSQLGSTILPISSSSSSIHFLISNSFCSISSFFSQIISQVLLFLAHPSFHCFQFLSNLPQYSLLYYLSDYPNSFFAVNCSSSSPLLNVPSFFSYYLTSFVSHWYFFSNSSTAPFAFSKFSIPSQVSDSAVNPFYHTRCLSFSLICHLFNILLTFHSFSPLIMTRAGCSFLCPSTCPMYLYILLIFTTGYILIILGNSNSTVFTDTIFFTL